MQDFRVTRMSFSAKAIANYFIDHAASLGQQLTPMKLQKLIYFAHGWNLAINNKPLINEQVEAWQFGPVIESVYHEFKHFGRDSIKGHAVDIELVDADKMDIRYTAPTIDYKDADTRALLDKIWDAYGRYTAIQLSNMTHKEGTPWEQTWGADGVPMGTDINIDVIKEYFISQAQAVRRQKQVVREPVEASNKKQIAQSGNG